MQMNQPNISSKADDRKAVKPTTIPMFLKRVNPDIKRIIKPFVSREPRHTRARHISSNYNKQ